MATDPATTSVLKSMDAQHREMMAALERFESSTEPLAQRIEDLLSRLEAYTREHFGFEEHAMTQSGYPERAGHVAAHQVVRARVDAVRVRFRAEGACAAVVDALRGAVAALLQDQMISFDRSLARFLKDRAD